MTDKEIAICKEIICDLNTYCALTPATYRPMGFEFQEDDFICLNNLIDLINRQKAEIERLKAEADELAEEYNVLMLEKDMLFDEAKTLIKQAKSEAIREFAEKVKSNCEWFFGYNISRNKLIDGIVKETTEGENG